MKLVLALSIFGAVIVFFHQVKEVLRTWRGTRRPETSSIWDVHLRQHIVHTIASGEIILVGSLVWVVYERAVVSTMVVASFLVAITVGFACLIVANVISRRYQIYEATHRTYGHRRLVRQKYGIPPWASHD
jgi:hypothetical protein